MHFYGSDYPVAPDAVLRPSDATVADYRHAQDALAVERVIVVQPTTYGLDNSCQADAIDRLGDRARGIAVVDANTSLDQLQRLHERGFRGARFHMLPGGAVGWHDLDAVARSVADLGWHVQLQMNGHELAERLDQLLALSVPLVIDHVGRFMPPARPSEDAVASLLALMDAGAHLKLSAPYESAVDSTHRYEIVCELVDHLVAEYPERLLWASNWPHPGQSDPPSLERLVELRDRWLPSSALREQVLATNPDRLYFS